jgi:hypothetical protein
MSKSKALWNIWNESNDSFIYWIPEEIILEIIALLKCFLEENIDKYEWNFSGISQNKGLTAEFIDKHPDWNWDWDILSRHLSVPSLEFIEKYRDKKWNWSSLLCQQCISLDIIEKCIQYYETKISDHEINNNPVIYKLISCGIYWLPLSRNPNLTIDYIKRYLDKQWHWHFLAKNSNLTIEFIKNHQVFSEYGHQSLSYSSHLTFEYIQNHPDDNWNWIAISKNPNIATIERIEKYPEYHWKITGLFYNSNFTIDYIIKQFKDYIQNDHYFYLSFNPNLTEKYILQNKTKKWHWIYLCRKSIISIEFLLENHNDISCLSIHPDIFQK